MQLIEHARVHSPRPTDHFQIWKCLVIGALHLLASVSASASAPPGQAEQTRAQEAACRLATEFILAQAAGADLSNVRDISSAIRELRQGIPGRGPYAKLQFHVTNLSDHDAGLAADYLEFDRGILKYHPPINYSVAWGSGIAPDESKLSTPSLSRLLAQRSADSYARVFDAAKAAAANLTDARDVESSMRLLETGIRGHGAHADTRFRIPSIEDRLRFQAKQMLRFHEGHLHFIPDSDQKSEAQILAEIESRRPEQLAQQVVALFETAKAAGAGFDDAATPPEIIVALRQGVHVSTNLGLQFFQISATGTDYEWARAVAYLQYRNATLSYVAPD